MGFLTILIYITLSLLLGFVFIGLSLNIIDVGAAASYLETYVVSDITAKAILGIAGFLMVLICLRYVQSIFRRSLSEKSITFESPEGTVDITLFAIEDMLRRMIEDKKELSHVKPRIMSKKRKMEVIIRGDLASEVNILEFTRGIQVQIKEKLENILGEDKEIKVRMKIRKMVFGGKKKAGEQETPEVPFRNY
jgi:hypothetical protein